MGLLRSVAVTRCVNTPFLVIFVSFISKTLSYTVLMLPDSTHLPLS